MPGAGNTAGSRVTLHVVSSLDGFIARKDNNVSWLDGHGSVYDAGVFIWRKKPRPSSKPSTVMCSALAPMNTHLNWAGPMAILRRSW